MTFYIIVWWVNNRQSWLLVVLRKLIIFCSVFYFFLPIYSKIKQILYDRDLAFFTLTLALWKLKEMKEEMPSAMVKKMVQPERSFNMRTLAEISFNRKTILIAVSGLWLIWGFDVYMCYCLRKRWSKMFIYFRKSIINNVPR